MDEFLVQALLEVQQYIVDGTKQGLSLKEIQTIYAVEKAVQSGELELPWSEEEAEEGLSTGVVEIVDTQRLMEMYPHPEFTKIACKWAYAKSPELFYTLWH